MAINTAVVGLGYWGPNVARNLNLIEGANLTWCCELDEDRRAEWQQVFPRTRFTPDLDEMLADDSVDAVAVTAPVGDHAPVASRVLDAGKHCFVEKPLTHSVEEAEGLVAKADEAGLTLMVGHLLEYHPAVEALEAQLTAGELGDLIYIYSNRLNLGKLKEDENVLWDLGVHDLSVILRLAGAAPTEVWAHGHSGIRDAVEDVAFAHMRFPSDVTAHMHLSWLDPRKERQITVVGSKRMAVFDDMAQEAKLTIYDKGFDPDQASLGDYVARTGEITSPAVSGKEPLRIEIEHWIDSVANGTPPRTDGRNGLRVVRVLDGMQRSLAADGERVSLDLDGAPAPRSPAAASPPAPS